VTLSPPRSDLASAAPAWRLGTGVGSVPKPRCIDRKIRRSEGDDRSGARGRESLEYREDALLRAGRGRFLWIRSSDSSRYVCSERPGPLVEATAHQAGTALGAVFKPERGDVSGIHRRAIVRQWRQPALLVRPRET
jgi:hypothetical protein